MRTFRELRQECQVLKSVAMYYDTSAHRAASFFVRCHGMCLRPLVLITEYAEFKSLDEVLKNDHGELSQLYLTVVAMEIITGIKVLHSMGLVWRDMKPGNILVFSKDLQTERPHVKLADFGTAVQLPPGALLKVVGTPEYQAPEIVLPNSSYGKPVDVYAFGLVVRELLTGEVTFANIEGPVAAAVRNGKRPSLSIPQFGGQLMERLCRECCLAKAEARPSASVVHAHLTRAESHLLLAHHLANERRSICALETFSNDGKTHAIVVARERSSSFVSHFPILEKEVERSSDDNLDVNLPSIRITCSCVVPSSRTLWLGTHRKRLVILSLADLSPEDSQLQLADVPMAIVANASHAFVALASGRDLFIPVPTAQHQRAGFAEQVLRALQSVWGTLRSLPCCSSTSIYGACPPNSRCLSTRRHHRPSQSVRSKAAWRARPNRQRRCVWPTRRKPSRYGQCFARAAWSWHGTRRARPWREAPCRTTFGTTCTLIGWVRSARRESTSTASCFTPCCGHDRWSCVATSSGSAPAAVSCCSTVLFVVLTRSSSVGSIRTSDQAAVSTSRTSSPIMVTAARWWSQLGLAVRCLTRMATFRSVSGRWKTRNLAIQRKTFGVATAQWQPVLLHRQSCRLHPRWTKSDS